MKRLALVVFLSLCCLAKLSAQVEIATKVNALYACVGIINPSAEFAISPKSTIQTEIIYSPWKSINKHHFNFVILMTEYRWHLKNHFNGVYFGANASMYAFDISKPHLSDGRIKLYNGYAKGCGGMIGVCVGYEKTFADRWILDAFFGWSRMWSYYNGYHFADETHLEGEIEMHPEGHENDNPPDPWNGSAEWYPNKIGVSIGYIFN